MAKLDVKAFGLTLGIVWGAAMFLAGVASMLSNWGQAFVELFSSLYVGYKATVPGSIIGAAWGFIDAGIGGIVVAWLYNKLAK